MEPILERFVADYERDPLAQDITFGGVIDELRWRVNSRADADGRRVTLEEGFGDEPMLYFKASRETLNLIDKGVWNGLTALGRQRRRM